MKATRTLNFSNATSAKTLKKMISKIDNYQMTCREFRNEDFEVSATTGKLVFASMFFLIIFVTGCSATYTGINREIKLRYQTKL